MLLTGITRIATEPVMRTTKDGTSVLGLTLVYSFGNKGEDGRRPSQFVQASFWGKRAESLQKYLTKGSQIGVTMEAPNVETYQAKDGTTGARLVARILDLELIAGQRQEQPVKQQSSKSDDGFDDDIPF